MTGNDLRNRRLALDMSQVELADALPCTQQQISSWENRNEQRLPPPRASWLEFNLGFIERQRAAQKEVGHRV